MQPAPGRNQPHWQRRPVAAAAFPLLVLLLATAGLPTACAARKDTKGARITLQTKWQGTPLVHEAAEFLAEEDALLFWRFVEDWQRGTDALGVSPTPQQCWAGIQAAAAAHLSPNMARLFGVSLAARQYSPQLELYRQLAEESRAGASGACCWALLGGSTYTAAAPLQAALAAALQAKAARLAEGAGHSAEAGAGAVYAFDHIYSSAASAAAPPLNTTAPSTIPVELFAPVGSSCAAELHAVLAAAVEAADAAAATSAAAASRAAAGSAPLPPRFAYAWRPVLDAQACSVGTSTDGEGAGGGGGVHPCTALGSKGRLVVPGYGVELALKNMEYNAQDDGKKADKAGEEAGDEEAASLEGSGGGEAADDGDDDEEGDVLKELAQDLPRLVRQLSLQKYGKSLRLAVESLQRYVPPGTQFLLLNGLTYDAHDFSLFDFLDVLRREVRLHDALSGLGLPPKQLREAMMLRGTAAGDDTPPRLRLVGDAIAWVNDLEADDQYAGWPTDLQSLLMPMYPGRLPQIARNVLTAIYAFDPSSPAALDIGTLLHTLDLQNWPLRMGMLPVVAARVEVARGGAGPRAADPPSLSERMGRLLALIQARFGGRAAAHFLYSVRQALPPPASASEDQQQPARAEQQLWAAAKQFIAAAEAAGPCPDPAAAAQLQAAAELAHSSGLAGAARSGVLVCNGVVSANDGSGGWQGVTMGAVQGQMQAVQEDVYMGRLGGGTADLYEEILRLHGSIPRYNPRILPVDAAVGYIRMSGETDEYPSRQLALTGPLLGLHATAAAPGSASQQAGLQVRYFGPQPSLAADDGEGEGEETAAPLAAVTHWVAADVGTRQGLKLVAAALQHRSSAGRMAVLVNSAAAAAAAGKAAAERAAADLLPVERVVVAVCSGLLDIDLIDFVDQLDAMLQLPTPPAELSLAQLDSLMLYDGQLAAALDALGDRLAAAAASQTRFVRQALGLGPGAHAVVSNGRLVELPAGPAAAAQPSRSQGGAALPTANGDNAAGAADAAADFETQDFELLELYAARNQYSERVAALVRAAAAEATASGDGAGPLGDPSAVAAAVSSCLTAAKPAEVDARSGRVSELISSRAAAKNFVRLAAAGGGATSKAAAVASAPLFVQAIIDPLSKSSQRLAPVLAFLRSVLDVDAELLLNPQARGGRRGQPERCRSAACGWRDYDSMPLKTFYRYVLPAVDASGAPAPASASFTGLPPDKVLTLGMDEPEPWLVEPVAAQHDLDNLRLQELGPGQQEMAATFELEALMLTGMCLDLASLAARMRDQIHPRGVQLELLPLSAPETAQPLVDTLVMSNLGYFQLKTGPGLWKLKLAPGRSQQLYSVASSTGASPSGQSSGAALASTDARHVPVAVSSFGGKHMHLFLRKAADRMAEDVLQAEEGDEGAMGGGEGKPSLWNKVASWAGSSGGADAVGGVPATQAEGGVQGAGQEEQQRETIHVFTVASGHMYERLQKIMFLSVVKRTPARVKFWFIKNYMSPQMKAFVPFMAEKYGFDYEFVTYKWPSWLHKQTEKQRIIWAYKILFLDVLFPLGLKKVIFCDSDQVVRADLRELWAMDLGGAPYAYTPFCDTNTDMEGFRFWKQGFWRDHLQGRPYHISALYVIDLERFRQMAAGDRLRVIYDGLSKDPGSLSNLDQDLPNYAQHGVPIFSLPREWLWCETWCGSESRPRAKTIDLCNNPLTKEPKLAAARRIIAEWPDLNREAEEFTAAVERVQRGEMSRPELMADTSLFHVRLTPMVEGSTWTSDSGSHSGNDGGGGTPAAQGDAGGQALGEASDISAAAATSAAAAAAGAEEEARDEL
ncbi:UDP-glucose:glycoprotein glucosyltransferase [Chlorella vulgaris]